MTEVTSSTGEVSWVSIGSEEQSFLFFLDGVSASWLRNLFPFSHAEGLVFFLSASWARGTASEPAKSDRVSWNSGIGAS